jgi:hypothetical protein
MLSESSGWRNDIYATTSSGIFRLAAPGQRRKQRGYRGQTRALRLSCELHATDIALPREQLF